MRLRHAEHVASTRKTVFVISPIGQIGTIDHKRHKLTLDYIIRKAFDDAVWEVIRADDESSPDSITSQVIERVVGSDLIVAVLTDHNPNVFYELAVAHGFKKPVLHLLESGQTMPFDIGDQRAIFYDLTDPESVDTAISNLRDSSEWVQSNPDKLRNPLSTYGQFALISATEGGGDAGDAVVAALQEISVRLSRLERSRSVSPTKVRKSSRLDTFDELLSAAAWNHIRGLSVEDDPKGGATVVRVMVDSLHDLPSSIDAELAKASAASGMSVIVEDRHGGGMSYMTPR